ncbi:MAG: hypothetical protein K6T26_05400 [Alicyclobacillus sp.]|nr:hypothetical protein [Alicyclobacillus sp.]
MSGLRATWRTIRILLMCYGLWCALLRSRWLTVVLALWRVLRGRPLREPRRAAVIAFCDAGEPAIYRRLGRRRIRTSRMRA